MRVLVIEDNQNLVANLFDYLEPRGHVVDAAPDGRTGLHLAITQQYDVIVLDWMLPRLDGPGVLDALRNESDSDVPVIMLTARDELPDKIAGFRAGADDYLTKPFALASPAAVSRERLEHALWGDNPPDGDMLRSHVYELRRSVDADFTVKLIHTLPRVGYRLAAMPPENPSEVGA